MWEFTRAASRENRLSSFGSNFAWFSHACLEVLGCFCQVCGVHHVAAVHHLGALLHDAFRLLCTGVCTCVHGVAHLRLVVPVDMELCHARFLCQNVAGKFRNVNVLGWVLVHLWFIVLNVYVVADTKEFLVLLVGAREEDGCHSHDVANWHSCHIRR